MRNSRWVLLAVLAAAVAVFFALDLGHFLSLEYLRGAQQEFRALYEARPALVVGGYFAAYVAVTALSLPGAAAMTLLGVFLVSLTRPRLVIAGPALSVFVAMLAVTLAQGASFGETPRWLAFTIGLAGPAVAAGLVRWRGR